MRERIETIARTLTMEQGKPLIEAKAEINQAADTFEWFAEEAKRAYGQVIPESTPGRKHLTIKHPVGVVATIAPFNFPVSLQCRKVAPALAAGCTVVAKPASQTPLSTIQVFECLVDAGLPAGAANLVMGSAREISAEFLENPVCRKISFTGSTEVGKQLQREAAAQLKHVSLELGGHAPFIVFPDADPEVVAKFAVMGKFRNNGQVCICPTRFFVHQKVQKDFTEATVELARGLKMGNGLDEGVELGPMFEASRPRTNYWPRRRCPEQRGQRAHRRRTLAQVRAGLFLRADRAFGIVPRFPDHGGRTVRAGDAGVGV